MQEPKLVDATNDSVSVTIEKSADNTSSTMSDILPPQFNAPINRKQRRAFMAELRRAMKKRR